MPAAGDARFTWEYDEGRARLLALYQKGKDKQWDASTRIDWSLEVDPFNVLGLGEESCPIYGSPTFEKLGQKDKDEMFQHLVAWQFSQFLHGEQGAMICSARIVESVPDLDAKFYASTQTMDEARHAETYARFLQEKVELRLPDQPAPAGSCWPPRCPTAAGTCPTSACRCSSRVSRWRRSGCCATPRPTRCPSRS